ncbi:MAG: TIGR03364 family FAD-dependent oxidoreductase [Silicimonas sp.]|nr:TIGR03364 family FAD-dependent oxidoreductase [Silicimonas sp.]
MMRQFDLAIVGAGIMGLAHAYHAANAGLRVAVFERDAFADGASRRNFGMLALVAQSPGRQLRSAERSLACWQDLARNANVALHQAGCLFLARTPEELSVMSECQNASSTQDARFELVPPDALPDHAAVLNPKRALGGLWSPDAWKVDQRLAMGQIAGWLQSAHSVAFFTQTEVLGIAEGIVETSGGTFKAGHTVVCGGDEFGTLFPDAFRHAQVGRCRLQMMRTRPQPKGWRLPPFLLGGLSLTRYEAFAACPSLPQLKAHQEKNRPDHMAHGIHVILAQEADGSVTIGDSHAYDGNWSAESSDEIDRLILEEALALVDLPEPEIAERWIGHYAHLSGEDALIVRPDPNVTLVTMTNGQGMTHGFAVAEDVIRTVFD